MPHSIESMIEDVLRREGGFSDHPADRGGPTKFGITQATLSGYLGKQATKSDVRGITKALAAKIYAERYFSGPGIDRLPDDVQPFLFDAAVNHGPRRAIKFLQSVCSASGFPCGVVDGVSGPQTRRSAERASEAMAAWLLAALVEERRNFYHLIVERDPSQRVFIRGWLNRLAEFDVELPEMAA